jgi:hypothetical protein
MTTIGQQIGTVSVGEAQESGNLQVFALRWNPGTAIDYATLDEAQEAGLLEVGEVSEGGSVPQLLVKNNADKPVFLMAGEHLRGGKQNRVLNASILVAARSNLPIPVSCVERGRWAYRAAHFGGSGSSSHSVLRKMMHSQVTAGYRSSGEARSDQGEVWREVDRKLSETQSFSGTSYLHKAYEDTEPQLKATTESLAVPEGASGVAFAIGGKIVGLDLFDRPPTLARLWPKLVRAYAIDARVGGEGKVSREAVAAWLGTAVTAKEETFRSAGMGDDVRLEAAELEAACLRVEAQPVHVEAFAR